MVLVPALRRAGALTNNLPRQLRVRWNRPGEEEDSVGHISNNLEEEQRPKEAPHPCLRLMTLNIVDGRRNRLNAALRCCAQMNVDVGLLTETKFQNDKYTKGAEGYTVCGTNTTGNNGGVALVYRNREGWSLESTKTFGPNVIRTTLVSGERKWYIVGCYIPPSEEDGVTLGMLTQAYESRRNLNWPVILLGDLNVNLDNPGGNQAAGACRRLETAALLDTWSLVSRRDQFRQCKKRIGRNWTWQKVMEGRVHRSICDYILTDNRQFITNCRIRQPRFDTDHKAIVAIVQTGPVKNHQQYINGRTKFPIKPVEFPEGNRADALLSDLSKAAQPLTRDEGRTTSWIS